jgi:hypothetical protein
MELEKYVAEHEVKVGTAQKLLSHTPVSKHDAEIPANALASYNQWRRDE